MCIIENLGGVWVQGWYIYVFNQYQRSPEFTHLMVKSSGWLLTHHSLRQVPLRQVRRHGDDTHVP